MKGENDRQERLFPLYAEQAQTERLEGLGSLLKGRRLVPVPEKTRKTERGELLKYFSGKLKMPIPRVAKHLEHLKEVRDLYYLKSDCDQAEARGVPWSAAFWTGIRPRE